MAKEITEKDIQDRRLKACVWKFPHAESGEHNPRCCRFPKPCSPYGTIEALQAGNISENDLEPQRLTQDEIYKQPRYEAERKTLRQLRVGSSFMVKTEIDDSSALAFEMDARKINLEAYVLQEHLADEYFEETVHVRSPYSWWDMLVNTKRETWWGKWLHKWYTVKFFDEFYPVKVKVERFANYPEADIAVPSLGRPVPYESLRRLRPDEIETMELQKQLESKRAELDKDEKMWVFLLIPETIEDLAEYTGLPKKHFVEMYNYDQEFGLNSKIYLIPEGVGYRYDIKED